MDNGGIGGIEASAEATAIPVNLQFPPNSMLTIRSLAGTKRPMISPKVQW